MNEAKIKEPIHEMVRLLITYEIELTAYQTAYDAVGKRVEEAGLDVNLSKLVRHVANSSSLRAEAEAEYARHDRIGSGTIDQLCEHFEQSEMRPSASSWSIATQKTYRSYISSMDQAMLGLSLSERDQGSGSGSLAAWAQSCSRFKSQDP